MANPAIKRFRCDEMKTLTCFLFCLSAFWPLPSPAQSESASVWPNDWEDVSLEGLNLTRLAVPGGWLIREGLGKKALIFQGEAQIRMMLFFPDPNHEWTDISHRSWEILRLRGLNLHRLQVPGGWLVREGWGKLGTENQTNVLIYLKDPEHRWHVKPKID